MQKNRQKNKGFSLIELIVVIAVIAAIAAVIVPSISNFSSEASEAADSRNVQLWNTAYLNARGADSTAADTAAPTDDTDYAVDAVVPAFTLTYDLNGTDIVFSAPAFTVQETALTFTEGSGLAPTP
jgi:prepilin-type N-terminal cleavage/methylation domain-containing protein